MHIYKAKNNYQYCLMKNNLRLEEEMRGHVNEWVQSGLKKKEYCNSVGMSSHKFSYWVQKLKAPMSSRSAFTEIAVESGIASMEIHYPSGLIVKIHTPVKFEMLKTLL